MKKYLSIFSLALVVFVGIILAQKSNNISYPVRWEKVEELAEKQLPESALKEVEAILSQAQNEKNSEQIIKAMLYKMRFTLEKDPDEAPKLISEFENFTLKSIDPTEKALLYSMTAELYANYYQNDSYTINQRTKVVGLIPEDVNEWTKNIYFDKISNLLSSSIASKDILQKTDALKFAALLNNGQDSRTLQPTLFDFLAYRCINILNSISQATDLKNPLDMDVFFVEANQFVTLKLDTTYTNSVENKILEIYQQLIELHLTGKPVEALLYADLERLQYVKNKTDKNELYLKALDRLDEKYSKNDFVVEIVAERANYYLQKSTENEENRSFRKKAFDICENGIKLFPKYSRIDLLKNIQKTITQKSLNVSHNEVLKPFSNLILNINSANISALKIDVYRINATAFEYFTFKQNKQNRTEIYPNRTLIESREMKMKTDPNFGAVDTTLTIKSTDYGMYEIGVAEKGNIKDNTSNTVFVVSDFGFITRSNKAEVQELYILDRQSGIQQNDVDVTVYEPKWTGKGYEYNLKHNGRSDKGGLCKIPFVTNNYQTKLFFGKGKDQFFTSESYAYYNENNQYENEKAQLNLFTDRSLYRPGQTVYFKGIAYFANKKRNEVRKSASYDVTLYDANNQKISSKTLKTNDFGSFAGEFILPENGLNGAFRIQSESFSHTIWVEEYKRPTFEVKIEKPKSEIKFGDKVLLIGNIKAYAGYNISDAMIKYRVVRRTHRFCWWNNEPDTEITNGITTSNAVGKFEVSFVPIKTKNGSISWRGNFYTYAVYADVTDPKGETQQGEQSLSVGDKSLFIVANVPEKIEKNSNSKLVIYTETLNGEKQNSVIDYEVYRLEDLPDYVENLKTDFEPKNAEKITSGKFNTVDKSLMLKLKKWKSAQYKLILKTLDAWGNEVKSEHKFIVYNQNDKVLPVKTYEWMLVDKSECNVGEKAQIRFGTSTKNTVVLYELMQGNKVLQSQWIKFSNEIKTFEIPFKESYGAGVTAQFSFMKDEKFFFKQVQITHKVVEKKLTPTLSVFRDKLLPGEKAEWTITIPESEKNKKEAEVLVGMYDASLDAIRPHSWSFSPVYNEGIVYAPVWTSNSFNKDTDFLNFDTDLNNVPNYQFDELNWFGLNFSSRTPIMIRGLSKGGVLVNNEIVSSGYESQKRSDVIGAVASMKSAPQVVESKEEITEIGNGENANEKEKPVQLRTNFNETAFFYPQLRTDEAGNVKFTFTAPESLTRWTVKMLAHTQDLYFGQAEVQVVTQKDLMVQMNLPRFVRRSDKLVLSANVINLTDKELKANVQFELIDPETVKPIQLNDNKVKSVTLAANETKSVEWEISEFSPYELVICKIVARAGDFSDGEQKYLPVLPDKVLITESMPMTMRGNQTRTFNFESLIKNASNVKTQNLAVEFSTNPAWYAVQALPTLSTPENENAMDYFTAYYANSLAAFIANSNPKIAATFDRWKKAGGSRDALLSNLEKNKELKNMLLEETPWVMAAKDETEQKKQIALLFDLNMQKNQSQQYLDKLLKLQTPDGGFAWFDGMLESRYITQEIMLNLARLKRMTNVNSMPQNSIEKALNYLDLEISRDFENLKKNNKNYLKQNCVGNIQLFYLHVRSEYPKVPIHVSAQEAVKFYTAQSEKYWTSFSLYGKAMMAVVANRNGKIQTANDILRSLKENALKTDEFGMYWAKNAAGYFWNERPIAVQAAIIEAFAEVSKNTSDVDEMKIWLLKQKQTQRWDSPLATVNAIYALLLQGSDWLNNQGSVEIKLGNMTLQPTNIEAGTGYFKETIPALDVNPSIGKVTVTTFGSANQKQPSNKSRIGWGAMYWQYYQDLDKVEGQSGPMKITKKLFVEKMTATGKTLMPIEKIKLGKGDKIITRLVITTDRNLEFVALKDLRASCFEPVNQISGSAWKEKVCYYQTTKDASTQFFFSYLPKGTYVFEYELWANNSGEFTSGIASVQCLYAPEFVSHTGGERIKIQ
ncbi:MAG: hypothetical protein GZ091_07990 [Paludibacter sp.]|nr:hypothetical protein [Paludibacter sp.]